MLELLGVVVRLRVSEGDCEGDTERLGDKLGDCVSLGLVDGDCDCVGV